jgi:hypothetical protein
MKEFTSLERYVLLMITEEHIFFIEKKNSTIYLHDPFENFIELFAEADVYRYYSK